MKTPVLDIRKAAEAGPAIAKAAQILADGGLVAFPTETVYGLAARADLPAARARLAEVKERPDTKPFSLHIGDKQALETYVGRLNPLDRALVRRALPGPLTIVFALSPARQTDLRKRLGDKVFQSLYHDATIGVRLPDHDGSRRVLQAAGGPIVAPSANRAGAAPPHDAQDVIAQLDGQIDLILDGGPTRYGQSSTVIKLGDGQMEVLRAGVLDADTVRRMRCAVMLFVCTGNTCRSPMAAGWARMELARRLGCAVDRLPAIGYKILSAGVMAGDAAYASGEAIAAGDAAGIDLGNHRATPLTRELVKQADYIFALAESHRRAVLDLVPEAGKRVRLLCDEGDVADPVGSGVNVYQRCLEQISACVKRRLDEIMADFDS